MKNILSKYLSMIERYIAIKDTIMLTEIQRRLLSYRIELSRVDNRHLWKQIFFQTSKNSIGFQFRFIFMTIPAVIYGFTKGVSIDDDPIVKAVMGSSFAACAASICYPVACLPLFATIMGSTFVVAKII
jgi:hypothetical protein